MTDLPVKIRAFRDTDKPFILDSWVNSIVYSTPSLFWCPKSVLKTNYRRIVDKLIDARPELFRVLVNEDDEDQIFAWVCGESTVRGSYIGDSTEALVHFVYTKEEFRHEGLAVSLIKQFVPEPHVLPGIVGSLFTNWTKDCEKLSITYKPSLFKELINGLDKTVVSYTPSKHNLSKQDIQVTDSEG